MQKILSAFLCLCISVSLLSACGFEPMYGQPDGSGVGARAGGLTQRVSVEANSGGDISARHLAEQFHTDLENRLQPSGAAAASPEYHLLAVVSSQETALAISPDGTTSRSSVVLMADLTLTRIRDGAMVYQGKARRTGSYDNVSNAFYSTYVSQQDAYRRAVTELAEETRQRLATFFAQNPDPHPMFISKPVKPGVTPAPVPAPSPILPLLPGGGA